jgi:hypothetical protein
VAGPDSTVLGQALAVMLEEKTYRPAQLEFGVPLRGRTGVESGIGTLSADLAAMFWLYTAGGTAGPCGLFSYGGLAGP